MNQEPRAIEVEIVEIDGVAPTSQAEDSCVFPSDARHQEQPKWREWGGRVRHFDTRWWPLWVIPGLIAVMLVIAVGLVLGIVFLIARVLRALARAIFQS